MRSVDGHVLAVLALLVGSMVGAGAALTAVEPATPTANTDTPGGATTTDGPNDHTTSEPDSLVEALTTFDSRAAFEAYVRRGRSLDGRDGRIVADRVAVPSVAEGGDGGGDGGASGSGDATVETAPSRIATTNVQVAGLDELDIVKTDGRHFYYAPRGRQYPVDPAPVATTVPERAPHEKRDPETYVIDAADPDAPETVAHVDATGRLLQSGDTLVVVGGRTLTGYDVSDPEDPTKRWTTPLNATLVTAREQNGTIYLVTRSRVGYEPPCPLEPLGSENAIACSDVYRPDAQIPVDAVYSAFAVDASSGEVRDSVSFVGTAANTVVYVSPEALYVTYTTETSRASLLGEYVREEFEKTPDHLERRVAEIQSYNISASSKEREIRHAVQRWIGSLPPAEREDVRRAFHDGFERYLADSQRSLTRTGIVRVDADGGDLAVEATGTVPGRPLDQFSLDQYDGTLRITTTVPATGDAPSVNDLYTLEAESLERQGSVTDMGKTERVYSVRYVGDTAYVVTFRRVDPFHVVDLSEPTDPEQLGELKLPGFSSYLHPIDADHVLGVGEEDGRVKTVLFDVSDPENPTIADDAVLEERWSAVSQTHHAFLLDRKHGVFFLPAGKEGIVIDYTGESLSVETRIETDRPPSRARYVEDSLYVFAGDSVHVLDERTWERTVTLHLFPARVRA